MIFQQLLDLGVNPRIAVAINRMITAGKLPDATTEQLRTASEMASKSLCDSIADTFSKVAKGEAPAKAAPAKAAPSGGGGGGGGGGGNCFVEGSKVRTASGSAPIETLLAGSKVLGFDESTGEVKTLTVDKTLRAPADSYLQFHTRTTSFNVTETHPILTRTGWVNAGNIREGDSILTITENGREANEVLSVASVEETTHVYAMEIAENPHTYIIDGIVAHNAKIADDDDEVEAVKMAEDMSEGDSKEASIRKDERKVAEWTVKLGYAIAKHLGADETTALTASMYAFTRIPSAHEVQAKVLEAGWWLNGRSTRQ